MGEHLPLRIAAPGRIETADGWSINLGWRDTRSDDSYAAAEAFAPVIVRAVNSHEALMKAAKNARDGLTFAVNNLTPDAAMFATKMQRNIDALDAALLAARALTEEEAGE